MSNKAKVVVNEEKISETPTVLVGASDKPDQLSPNPAHSGFTKQLFVDSLPGTGEPNVIYCVAIKTGPEQAIVGYRNYKWDLERKRYERVFDNDPALKILQGPQGVEVNEVNPPKKAPEKVFEGEVVFKEEPTIEGKKLHDWVDSEGGVTQEELNAALALKQDKLDNESAPSGVVTKLIGFDSEGKVVSDDVPEGIVVDDSLDTSSNNAIANKPVAEKFAQVDEELAQIDEDLETKANVDGNYPTMTVGVADNLSPYDEEAGIKQSAPFNFQASGTNNGSNPLATVGELALLKEKQGNTVVVNQKSQVQNETYLIEGYVQNSNWTNPLQQIIVSDDVSNLIGHKFLGIFVTNVPSITFKDIQNDKDLTTLFTLEQGDLTDNKIRGALARKELTDTYTGNVTVSYYLIDLTKWFNGDIPQDLLDHPDHFFRYYQGSLAYNEGTLVNANGRYIKCIGRNQFDGTNDVKVVPNSTYYIYGSATLTYKDKDGNTISSESKSNETFDVPANCLSIGVSGSGNICISLYYEDESGYDQYYPYKVLTNNDTGAETLRSTPKNKDSKLPSGAIDRKVANLIYSGGNTITIDGQSYNLVANSKGVTQIGDSYLFTFNIDTIEKDYCESIVGNEGLNNYGLETLNPFSGGTNKLYVFNNDSYLSFAIIIAGATTVSDYDTLFSNRALNVNANLTTPTTEQGTPFSENVEIDDFGSMSFEGTNGVPQGNLIFYPVDYKAYLDTLHKYTDGDPDNLALKSDLAVVNEKIGAKIPECPTTTDGTYVLKATVSNGSVVYSWVLEE